MTIMTTFILMCFEKLVNILIHICHGATCLQVNDAEDVKDDRLGKEKRKEEEESN